MNKDRRKTTNHEAGDRFTKQLIIWTLCLIAGLFAGTVCAMSLQKMAIPDALDRLITFIVGNLTGMLAKTGIDAITGSPANPLTVENAPDKPLETTSAEIATPEAEAPETATQKRVSPLAKMTLKEPEQPE